MSKANNSVRDKEIFNLYKKGLNCKSIAFKMKITVERVRQIVRKAEKER